MNDYSCKAYQRVVRNLMRRSSPPGSFESSKVTAQPPPPEPVILQARPEFEDASLTRERAE